MAASKLLLSILPTEYETQALGEWVTSRQSDVEDCTEADCTTSEGARSVIVAYWKDDLVIEGCSEDPLACASVAGPDALPEWTRHNLRRGALDSAKGRSIGLSYVEMAVSSMG
jgi:hypothetical protein